MTHVDEKGWVRDFSEHPTLPEIHVIAGIDELIIAEAFVRAAMADEYGSDPDPDLVHAGFANRAQTPGAIPDVLIEDETAPMPVDPPEGEGEDVDLTDAEDACTCGGAFDDRDHAPSCAGWEIARGGR